MRLTPTLLIVFAAAFLAAGDAFAQTVDNGSLSYGQSGNSNTRNRTWTDATSTWGAAGNTQASSTAIYWVVSRQDPDPSSSEELVGVLSDTGTGSDLSLLRWNGSVWSKDWTSTAMTSTNSHRCGFDVAYEQTSGDALVVYSNNNANPLYQTWNGTVWSGGANV
ncbi:MAG: hypothetical protein ACYTAF_07515, partial [Planctomycetota bacterium]